MLKIFKLSKIKFANNGKKNVIKLLVQKNITQGQKKIEDLIEGRENILAIIMIKQS